MTFAEALAKVGLSSGPIFVTRVLKGKEASEKVAESLAQLSARATEARLMVETEPKDVASYVARLAKFYHSEHVEVVQPWILETPFEEYRDRKLAEKGWTLNE